MRVCVLSSGSKGNSTYVETKNHKILIDIGTSSLYVEKALKEINVDPKDIDVLLITHSHVDHVSGLKVFCKKYNPTVYISPITLKESLLDLRETKDVDDIDISGIKSVKLSHDTGDIRGYIIEEDNSSMVYITDTGYIREKDFDTLKNKTLYVFESNHDVEKLMDNPNYPHHVKIRILSDKGHLSNIDSSKYMAKFIGSNTKYVVLSHLSEQNNTEDLAINTLKNTLKEKKVNFGNISIARQNEKTEIFNI